MVQIRLSKYGFVRVPENDFSDDGTRFTTYQVGKVEVTYARADGKVYIDGRRSDYELSYDYYSSLPHYNALSKLNGVWSYNVSEQDLIDFYNDCIAFSQEYENKVKELNEKCPTDAEIDEITNKVIELRTKEYNELQQLFTMENFVNIKSEYAVKSLHDYLFHLQRECKKEYYQTWYHPSASHRLDLIKRFKDGSLNDLQPDFYYRESKEILLGK